MRLQQALEATSNFVPDHFERFREHIDPVWIEEALCATGFASLRPRRLPAEQVVWLVIGMGLMRNESIWANKRCSARGRKTSAHASGQG